MKRILFTALFLLAFLSSPLSAEETTRKILIVTGGHGFDEQEFYEMFDAMPGVTYDRAELPKDQNLLAPGLETKYDAVVSYDLNNFPLTEVQRVNFEQLLQNGMPLIVFHHSLAGYQNWPTYRDIAGGAFLFAETEVDGKTCPASTYQYDVEMKIAIADKNHPITQGMEDFEIRDEIFKNVYIHPGVHVLLTTDHPDATREVAWVHRYGNSPVFTLMLGHDKHAFADENLRKLLRQGIAWGIAEKEKIDKISAQNPCFRVFRKAMLEYVSTHGDKFIGSVRGIEDEKYDVEIVSLAKDRNIIGYWDINTREKTITRQHGFQDERSGEMWTATFHYDVDESDCSVSIISGEQTKDWWGEN